MIEMYFVVMSLIMPYNGQYAVALGPFDEDTCNEVVHDRQALFKRAVDQGLHIAEIEGCYKREDAIKLMEKIR